MRIAAGTPPLGVEVAVALLAGVGGCLLLPWLTPRPLLVVLLLASVAAWWTRGDWRRIAGALVFGFALAGLHAAVALARELPPDWEQHDAVVTGRIVELPVEEERRTRFLFRVDGDDAQPARLRGRLLRIAWYEDDHHPAASHPHPALASGSRWRMQVRLRAPRGLRNPGGGDSEQFALAQRVSANGYVRNPELARRLAPPAGLDAWRDRMSARITKAVHAPSSRFVRALALGDTRALDDDDWGILRAAGLTHLIAISGFHVGLVAGLFALAASGLWRMLPALGMRIPRPPAAAVAAVIGAVGYTAIAGFALPTVRTALMIAIVAAARVVRRPQSAGASLALAVIAILLADPLSLLTAGFWLSVLGVAWLLWCLPDAGRSVLRDFASAQAVATVGLLPLTVVLFGQASLAGPLANLLAVPWWSLVVVPLALLGTGLEALHADAGEWMWRLSAWTFDLAWPLFQRIGSSELAMWWLPEARWFALPMALSGAFWLLLPRGVPGKPLAVLLWLPLLWPQRDLPAHGGFDLTVIDVGQGLSVVVRTSGHTLLYDMGPAVHDGFDAGERAVTPTLHALGVARIDAAVISHGDNDHAGGWPAVEREFPVVHSFAPEGSPTAALSHCIAGKQWRWDGVTFRFLHPTPDFPYLGNEAGCVLRIEGRHHAVLLTADIGEVIERGLVRRVPQALRADVVVVPHHGSNGSSDPEFIVATHARFALVSSGWGNRFGHPRPQVVERWCAAGARVVDTSREGALTVRADATGITLAQRRFAHPRFWDAARRVGQTHFSCGDAAQADAAEGIATGG
jgi:competence protein ComEC